MLGPRDPLLFSAAEFDEERTVHLRRDVGREVSGDQEVLAEIRQLEAQGKVVGLPLPHPVSTGTVGKRGILL